jgi:hypothetical protein
MMILLEDAKFARIDAKGIQSDGPPYPPAHEPLRATSSNGPSFATLLDGRAAQAATSGTPPTSPMNQPPGVPVINPTTPPFPAERAFADGRTVECGRRESGGKGKAR